MIQETPHSALGQEEQLLHEVLKSYGNKSILPDKDQAAKLLLLRVFLKKRMLQLVASEPSISYKQAILTLISLLPDDSREETFHLAIAIASRYWPSVVYKQHSAEIVA